MTAAMTTMTKIFVLHENATWVEPLRAAFDDLALPYEEWFLDEGNAPLHSPPPKGVFYNRMSASSHTRGHRYAAELAHAVLNWLESHGRRVVNSSRALYLETSKVAQYAALRKAGIQTPRTVAVTGRDALRHALKQFGEAPFILKPNRGGKGLGVRLFQSSDAAEAYLDSPEAENETPIDGIWLVQDYVAAPSGTITRAEFVGGRFLYAVQVDSSDGFELCPADSCEVEGDYCPANSGPSAAKFTVLPNFAETAPGRTLIPRYEAFLRANGIEIAGIEFIQDRAGKLFTYDINTNTNYNAAAEAAAGLSLTGMQAVARFLGGELAELERTGPRIVAAGNVAAE